MSNFGCKIPVPGDEDVNEFERCGREVQATQRMYWTLDGTTGEFAPSLGHHTDEAGGEPDFTWLIYCEADHQLGEIEGTVTTIGNWLREQYRRNT